MKNEKNKPNRNKLGMQNLSNEGLTLKTSTFKSLLMANLLYNKSLDIKLQYYNLLLVHECFENSKIREF